MIEKKIVILGRGNAGCISALHLRHELNEKVEIEMIYDSNIPPVPTGQGTALGFPENISNLSIRFWYVIRGSYCTVSPFGIVIFTELPITFR